MGSPYAALSVRFTCHKDASYGCVLFRIEQELLREFLGEKWILGSCGFFVTASLGLMGMDFFLRGGVLRLFAQATLSNIGHSWGEGSC